MEKRGLTRHDDGGSLRYGVFIPLTLMIAAMVSSCFSYSNARQRIADDLNEAILGLANEYSELWTRQDTVAALRQMHETTPGPIIYQATDVNFRNAALRDDVYFTLALVDRKSAAPKIHGDKIVSDSVMLVPEKCADGVAIRLQGFADCSVASVFAASDQTLPGVLFTFSILSMASMVVWRRRGIAQRDGGEMVPVSLIPSVDGIKLTPMQRKFTQLLLEAPGMKVDKATLCAALWDNKSNAEESLYTLVRRTKAALAGSDIEIVCNRGDSYELRITG